MAKATDGDRVRVHYTGRLDDESVFDSSRQRDPLEFRIGEGAVIPGFEAAVIGLSPGESTKTRIPAEQAYGPRKDDLLITVERERLPEDLEVEPGSQLSMRRPDGGSVPVTVVETSESSVVLDANHPLAGQPLNFEIELVEIV